MEECSKEWPMYCQKSRLDELFRNEDCLSIETLVNSGGREIDIAKKVVRNDEHWKGFFAGDHAFSFFGRFMPFPPGFKKKFYKNDNKYMGLTTDADGIIRGNNELKEVKLTGDSAGRYVLLNYTDLQWRIFYDLLKPISKDVIIGKAYLGFFPRGIELLTFSMTRRYGFDFLSTEDHRELFEKSGRAPAINELEGKWKGRLVSNSMLLQSFFVLSFKAKEGGVEGKWKVLDFWEGDSKVELKPDQVEMFDFTPWHDTIRMITPDFMIGKYCQPGGSLFQPIWKNSLGTLHVEEDASGRKMCLYYTLERIE